MALYDIVVKMYDVSYRAVETRTTDSDFLYKDGKQDQDFFFIQYHKNTKFYFSVVNSEVFLKTSKL